jgi:hypothetical protein
VTRETEPETPRRDGLAQVSGRDEVPEPTEETERLATVRRSRAGKGETADQDAGTSEVRRSRDEGAIERVRELLGAYRHYVAAGLVLAIAASVVAVLFPWGEEEARAPSAWQGARPAGEPVVGARDTGIAFEEPVRRDGDYYLRAGSVAWKGKLEKTDTGEILTLEGPTAAQFRRAITLPDGSVTTGVIGRAEPEGPILHATFQRTDAGTEELTQGTYSLVDGDTVLVEGHYADRRDGGSVTRTYTEDESPATAPGIDRRYAVRFEAPAGIPIPILVGWRAPEPALSDG